jgi:sugar lactone lactonase YvrE
MARFWVKEKTSALYTADVQDHQENAIGSSDLGTLTLTLYDVDTNTIINSRNAQNVLNANGVALDANGNLSWVMSADDNTIVTSTTVQESHIALFQWTWDSGNKAGKHEVQIYVENLTKVT